MDNILKELEADVWMCSIGSGCNSTTEINIDIKDKHKTTIDMSGIGIVYGVTLFANHRCESSLHFGNHRPASKQARVMKEFRKFRLPVHFRDGRTSGGNDDLYVHGRSRSIYSVYQQKRKA